MRLSALMFFKKTVNGYIFRGKNRLVKPVSRRSVKSLHKEYEVNEQNMLLLRHPYLTVEESKGHAKALGAFENKMEKYRKIQLIGRMRPDVTLEGRLGHLTIKDAWD
uniref:CSON012283 protein n=1 Tax=Culicoides sonorensis TaxID=179676 RepID=A0A336LRH6_CULSO